MNVTKSAQLLGLLCLVNAGGCMRPSREARLSDLALARPVPVQPIWKVRVPLDAQLGNRMQRGLCTEFSLLEIYNEVDFEEFCRKVGFRPDQVHPDFETGALIGIIAAVGEQMGDRWPIAVETIRLHQGAGWIKARFRAGTYFPLRTAAYCDLVYVSGLKEVLAVEINRRTFLAQ